MMQISRMFADQIREHPRDPPNPRGSSSFLHLPDFDREYRKLKVPGRKGPRRLPYPMKNKQAIRPIYLVIVVTASAPDSAVSSVAEQVVMRNARCTEVRLAYAPIRIGIAVQPMPPIPKKRPTAR